MLYPKQCKKHIVPMQRSCVMQTTYRSWHRPFPLSLTFSYRAIVSTSTIGFPSSVVFRCCPAKSSFTGLLSCKRVREPSVPPKCLPQAKDLYHLRASRAQRRAQPRVMLANRARKLRISAHAYVFPACLAEPHAVAWLAPASLGNPGQKKPFEIQKATQNSDIRPNPPGWKP
jgi:hypothetical protein